MKREFGIILSVAVLIATCQLALHDWRGTRTLADATVHVAPNRANASASGLSKPDPLTQRRILKAYGELPLAFEKNQGQTNSPVKFISRGPGYTLFLTADEAVLSLPTTKANDEQPRAGGEHQGQQSLVGRQLLINDSEKQTSGSILRMDLVGANPNVVTTGIDELPSKSNYFLGNDSNGWQRDIPMYAKAKYEDVYSGVDLVYYGNQRLLEYDFVVAPGADAKLIRLRFAGAQKLKIDKQGALVLETRNGGVRLEAPKVYQDVEGSRRTVAGRYSLQRNRTLEFEVGSYDRTKPLFID
ncbi:MAG TPA: hypothetical protein VGR93_13045, partial [Candidatus Acidoferrales bacterium]|nr:hypothetical protein [Candidatus Acidoferrales bacterium]